MSRCYPRLRPGRTFSSGRSRPQDVPGVRRFPLATISLSLVLPFLGFPAVAGATDALSQLVVSPPVQARLSVSPGPWDVSTPVTVQLEVTVPSLDLEAALASAQPARYRPEPRLESWLRIPHLPLIHIQTSDSPGQGARPTISRWTYRFEPALPGDLSLPPLSVAFRPVSPEDEPLEITFAAVPLPITALIAEDPSSAQPRPPGTQLPRPPFSWPRWLLITLLILVWATVRFGYPRLRRSRRSSSPGALQPSPAELALDQLRNSPTAQEAYQILRRFLRDQTGVDLAALSPGELPRDPRLAAYADSGLVRLVEDLQPGAYSREDAPLDTALRDRLRSFLASCPARSPLPSGPPDR